MLEQAVIRIGDRPRSAVTFPVSVTLHAFAVTAAILAAMWHVEFPFKSPDQMELLHLSQPMQLPPSNPPATKPHVQTETKPQLARVNETPTAIPDEVRPATPAPGPANSLPVDPNASTIGDGIEGTDTGGPGVVQVAEPTDPVGPLVPGGDVKAPEVLQRVNPTYPPMAVRMHLNGMVIVSAIIDKNGVVQNASLVHASNPMFAQPALDAVKRWRFKAGSLNGRAVDTIFNLTVTFQIQS